MGGEREFFFISDSLALDLVNTEAAARGRPIDLLALPADATAWWDAARARHGVDAGLAGAAAFGEDELAALKRLRGALRRICDWLVAGDQSPAPDAELAEANRQLGRGRRLLSVEGAGRIRDGYAAEGSAAERVLFAVGQAAANLFAGPDVGRLHRCHNGRCVLYFYDTTKSATRRWCSTACMNRARSLQRYAERKGRGEP
ncbi:MAG TPA: ABATE domain-containing protein [Herpetosiphonaceae bacterium]